MGDFMSCHLGLSTVGLLSFRISVELQQHSLSLPHGLIGRGRGVAAPVRDVPYEMLLMIYVSQTSLWLKCD